jgi:hypothetical protein
MVVARLIRAASQIFVIPDQPGGSVANERLHSVQREG